MINAKKIQQLIASLPNGRQGDVAARASEEQLDAFAERTGLELPHDARHWLSVVNGAYAGPGGLFGIRSDDSYLDMESYLALFPNWKSKKWIPVAGDGCGNYYIIALAQEFGSGFPVLFVESCLEPDEPAYIVASDLGHFLMALLEKELGVDGWPFNDAHVIHADPNITSFSLATMPWATC